MPEGVEDAFVTHIVHVEGLKNIISIACTGWSSICLNGKREWGIGIGRRREREEGGS
jgi:hypothetical protein